MKFGFAAAALAAILVASSGAYAAGPGTSTYTYKCGPNQVIAAGPFPTGGPYTAAPDGIVTGVNPNDNAVMDNAGCLPVGVGVTAFELLGKLNANMNVTTDQPFTWFAPANTTFRMTKITCTNASISLTTAAGGIYTRLAKGGTVVVLAANVFSTLTGPTLAQDLAIVSAPGLTFYPSTPATASADGIPVFNLTTAQGAASTLDCYVYGQIGQ